MKKFRKYGSIFIVFAGLAGIFFFLKTKAPHQSRVEFKMAGEGVEASRIALDYRKIENGKEESFRKVDRFPKARVAMIQDEPGLPEGEYVIELTLWMGDKVKSFRRRYSHGADDLTRFTINP
ncbi:MAG: hypothetical protein ABIJ56_06910 [Pseudomonadota bacterium]